MTEASAPGFTGLQKAATLLATLGVERSSSVLQNLGEGELERVLLALSGTNAVSADVRHAVLQQAHELALSGPSTIAGGIAYTRELLARTVGPQRSAEILEHIAERQQRSSFEIVRDTDPAQVAGLLSEEHPQTITVVLSYLEAKQAAVILSNMSPELQVDVTLRLAQMERISPEVIKQLDHSLKDKLSGVLRQENFKATDRVAFIVKVLNQVDRGVQKMILEGLEVGNPKLAEEVRASIFTFDDIVKLDDRTVQRVLRDVNKQDLTLALKGAPETIRDLIFRNMSERARQSLKEELDILGPQLAKNVYVAQRKIVDIIRALEATEEIIIAGEGKGNELIT